MIITNLKLAIRNLVNQRLSTVINILGLTAGLTAAIFVLLFIINELSYDKHHKNIDRIYRVIEFNHTHKWMMATTPFPLAGIILEESPAVENAVRIERISPVRILKGLDWIPEEKMYSGGPELFEIFTYPVLQGNPADLNNPNTAVLSRSSAAKYFNRENPIGKVLEIKLSDSILLLEVVGVMKDLPQNITFRPEIIVSPELGLLNMSKNLITMGGDPPTPDEIASDWEFNFFTSYLMLKENADTSQVYAAFQSLEKKYYGDESRYSFHLQPLRDIYLGSGHLINDGNPQGDRQVLYIFSGIGVLIIFISLLNYILLYSGHTIARFREYGMRRVVGATGKNMFNQVLSETILLVILVLPICLVLIEVLRPLVSRFLEKQMILEQGIYWQYILGVVIITLLVGAIPGIAMLSFIARIRPVSVFESNNASGKGQTNLRTILVFSQFIVFNILIISSLGIYKQVQYPMKKDLGFQWEDLIKVSIQQVGSLSDKFSEIKNELSGVSGISGISGGMFIPPTNSVMSINMKKLDGSDESVNLEALFVDLDFIETMGIKINEGQSFSVFPETGGKKVLLNQKAVEQLGAENPIGEKIMGGEIVGIISDFNTHSLHREIPPTIIISGNHNLREMIIRTGPEMAAGVRDDIISAIRIFYPDSDPEIIRMEEELKDMYKKERITAATIGVLTMIAVIIGAMGLFGISMHMLQRRRKEFAVRKVCGAGFDHIIGLMAKNYLILILSTLALASPVAVYLLNRWLQNFVFRTSISWWIFLASGCFAMIIVSITVGYHVIKTARTNPTENLRNE